MNKLPSKNERSRIKKIFIMLILIFIALVILVYSISNTIKEKRHLPSLSTTKTDLAIRGNIVSADNFTISVSKKIYTASIDTRSLDKNKMNLFIKLFSIYSSIDEKTLKTKIIKSYLKPGFLILSTEISSRDAKNLKLLAYKLQKLKVFKSIKLNGSRVVFGLSLYETGEKRLYPYKDTLTPVIGYYRKHNNKKGKLTVEGVKGIEKEYDTILNNGRNGILKGDRDISSYIIFNKDSKIQTRKDGKKLKLNIPLKLQKNIEIMLDSYKIELKADEIIASIIDSKTGAVYSLASTNRFNPEYKTKDDIPNLNVNAIEQTFEPGSVIKPIAIALVLDKHRATMKELFNAHNKSKVNSKGEYAKGRMKLGRWTIRDDHNFKKRYLTISDIVIYSSNIGTLQLAQRLSGKELLAGYKAFGIPLKSGIDLPYEKRGSMPKLYQLQVGEKKGKPNVFKATVSYGQGMRSSFMQVLKAYTVFNNDGHIVTPMIVKKSFVQKPIKVISKKAANTMKRLLIKTVNTGTGKKALYPGLEIGGKTGTANIARGGKYKKKYMSSFFGFANDKEKRYSIGVTVNNPNTKGKKWYQYYASQSAVPVFNEIVKIMVKLNYLTPEVVLEK